MISEDYNPVCDHETQERTRRIKILRMEAHDEYPIY
jgi:hypothetical protein